MGTSDEPKAPRILIVEDDSAYLEAILLGLRREGFEAVGVETGIEAMDALSRTTFDLVLLDLMLPGWFSGLDVCREIVKRWELPVIVVTAKDSEADSVAALEMGAEDYVRKPFGMRELVARIRVALRRHDSAPRRLGKGVDDGILRVGDVQVDLDAYSVTVRGRRVHLRPKEFELLSLLMASAGKVVSRETLIDDIWGLDYVGNTKTLDVHVKRVREKIEEDPSQPRHIVTVRGVGYKFEP